MIEIRLNRAAFGVAPLPGGGRQIIFHHEPSEQCFVAPLTPEGVKRLIEELSMSDGELAERIKEESSTSRS